MALGVDDIQLDVQDKGLTSGLVVLACLLAGLGAFMYLVTDENLPVLLPLAVTVLVCGLFAIELQRRTPWGIPLFEPGMVFAGIVGLYAVYPPAIYLVNDMTHAAADNRMYHAMPDPEDIGRIAWFYCIFLTGFSAVYLMARGTVRRVPRWRPAALKGRAIVAVVVLFVISQLCLLSLGVFYDMSFESYTESYLVIGQLPLFVRQVAAHVGGVMRVLSLAVLFVLFQNYRKYRWVIWVWIGAQVAAAFLHLGARTEAVVLAFAAVIMYHYLVKPIRWGPAFCAALVAVSLFLVAGVLRSAAAGGETGETSSIAQSSSEFEVLFSNAVDLQQRKINGEIEPLGPAFYFADVVALVPQQLLPFQKVKAYDWYLETYYPAVREAGGGMAFGIVSESIVGLGVPGLIFRGAIVGWLLALFSRRFSLQSPSAWSFLFHVWLTITCYQILRDTTFSMLALFFWGFFPVYVFVGTVEILCADDPPTRSAKV